MLRRFSILILLCGLWWIPISSAADEPPRLLVVGDSLSAAFGIPLEQGWVALLAERLQIKNPAYQVINASISGETTMGGLTRLPALLERHEPEWVIISLGGNDGLRGIALSEMRGNLQRMIHLSRDGGAQVLLVGIQIPPSLGRQYTQRFYQIYHELAEEYALPLVPFLLEDVALVDGMMQADGIHPTAAAQPIMLENVWSVLAKPLLVPATNP